MILSHLGRCRHLRFRDKFKILFSALPDSMFGCALSSGSKVPTIRSSVCHSRRLWFSDKLGNSVSCYWLTHDANSIRSEILYETPCGSHPRKPIRCRLEGPISSRHIPESKVRIFMGSQTVGKISRTVASVYKTLFLGPCNSRPFSK